MSSWEPVIGAQVTGGMTRFSVWAPEVKVVELIVETPGREGESYAMTSGSDGFHVATVPGIGDGDLYRYRLDGRGPFPDPVSRFQPGGVHGPSQIVDWRRFPWTDSAWTGITLDDAAIYEVHIGAFTPEGTLAAASAKLPYLRELGITAVELMPLSDCPGNRNWGYDGVAPFAPAHYYGTPDDLREFVDHAHTLSLAVYLDVVYNHLGPDGAYQSTFSPFYYSQTHKSPWGDGINFDGPQSEPVRDYIIQNALRWIHEYHFDGLRLDATHAIVDDGPRHIIASLAAAVRHSTPGRRVQVMAEDDRNFAGIVTPEPQNGWGLDALWADDFHHHMRRALAGDSDGYFRDFDGSAESIATTIRQGWFYTGQHTPYFGKPRGTDTTGIDRHRFIVCLQNHDQIGNRAMGDRIHHRIDPAQWRAASTLLLMLPETPLLFMGQEWAASTPFQFFTDHNAELGRLVTEGRRREFGRFTAFADPAVRERIPDPQCEQTFLASHLRWEEMSEEPHASVLSLYRRLLSFRKTLVPDSFEIDPSGPESLLLRRKTVAGAGLLIAIRLKGAGRFDLPGEVEVLFTTEDPSFVPIAQPPKIEHRSIEFFRPGAAILRILNEERKGEH